MKWRGWAWGFPIAVQFLTRIPIRCIPDAAYDDCGGKKRSVAFFPLVGVVVALIGAGVYYAASWLHFPSLMMAILTATATACVTGCFHEDGFADTCDALGPHNREDALRAMRDSRIGTFGAVGLWSMLTLKTAAIMALPGHCVLSVMIAAHMLARLSSLPLSLTLPYAQETKGLGAGLASLVSWQELIIASVITVLITYLLLGGKPTAYFALATAVLTAATGLFYSKRFAGVTGDCLGATNQIVETSVLLIAGVILTRL